MYIVANEKRKNKQQSHSAPNLLVDGVLEQLHDGGRVGGLHHGRSRHDHVSTGLKLVHSKGQVTCFKT